MQYADEDGAVEDQDDFDEAELFIDPPDPPHGLRFGEGQPINRRGRPRGSPNIATMVRRVGLKRHRVEIEGKVRRKNTVELVALALRRKAIQGDNRALKLMQFLIAEATPMFSGPRGILIGDGKLPRDEWQAVFGYEMTDAEVKERFPYLMIKRKRHQDFMRDSEKMAAEAMQRSKTYLE